MNWIKISALLTLLLLFTGCQLNNKPVFTDKVLKEHSEILTEENLPKLQFYISGEVLVSRIADRQNNSTLENNALKLSSSQHRDEVLIKRLTPGQFYRWEKTGDRITAVYIAFEVPKEGLKFVLGSDGKYYLHSRRTLTRDEYDSSLDSGAFVFDYKGKEYLGKESNKLNFLYYDANWLDARTKETQELKGLMAK